MYESISVKTIISNLESLAGELKSVQDLIAQLKKEHEKFIQAEIDGEHFFRGISVSTDFVEVKLYTHPPDDPLKVLKGHLQQKVLTDYFMKNKFLALMGFA